MFHIAIVAVLNITRAYSVAKQPNVGIKEFIPPTEGGNINWVLEQSGPYEWCATLFTELMSGLTENYSPSSIYTEINRNDSVDFDLKGTYFVNWFMGTDFQRLTVAIESHLFSKERNDDWFFFIDVCLCLFFQ